MQRFLEDQRTSARDNSRTPFQWDGSANAGFTTGTPWIKINPDHVYVNQQAQEADKNSVLNYFRMLVHMRKERPELVYGHYTLYDEEHPKIFAYTRVLGKDGLFVVMNFSNTVVKYTVPEPLLLKEQDPVLNNEMSVQMKDRTLTLLPWQSLIYELGPL